MPVRDGLTVVGLAIALLVLASLLVYGVQRLTRKRGAPQEQNPRP